MKATCWFFALIASFNAFAEPIRSYEELTSAIRMGHHFVILLDHAQCTGYFTPSSMLLIPASEQQTERVITSHLHFTDHLGFPAYEYIKYTFHADNSVIVLAATYDPQYFTPIGTKHTIECSIGNGIKVHSKH